MRVVFVLFLVGLQFLPTCEKEFGANVVEEGKAELQRVRMFASQRYGECWSQALDSIDASCREFTADMQSRIALRFTHCHLQRSRRPFPECPEGTDVSFCTRDMDPVAFNTYTEFFTHAHSICHYLQSENWQHRAETTIHRLTESSADVVEQLASTQRMAEDLAEAQNTALRSQETILRNGEELKLTLHHSTQGLREVFAEMKLSAHEQHVAFAEIFNRVAFLQSFILSESHTLASLLFNSLAFAGAFLLTATRRTARARLFLFGLVGLNMSLERIICRSVLLDDTNPSYQQMERLSLWVGVLRRVVLALGLLVLVYCVVRYRDLSRESLQILTQLRETQSSLQEALQQAENLSEQRRSLVKRRSVGRGQRSERQRKREEEEEEEKRERELKKERREEEEEDDDDSLAPWSSTVIQDSAVVLEKLYMSSCSQYDWQYDSASAVSPVKATRASAVSPGRRRRGPSPSRRQRGPSPSRRPPSSPLVYSVLVEDKQARYNLRNRRSSGPVPEVDGDRGNRSSSLLVPEVDRNPRNRRSTLTALRN